MSRRISSSFRRYVNKYFFIFQLQKRFLKSSILKKVKMENKEQEFLEAWLTVVGNIELDIELDSDHSSFFPITEDIERYNDLIELIKNSYRSYKTETELKKHLYDIFVNFDIAKPKIIKKHIFGIDLDNFF